MPTPTTSSATPNPVPTPQAAPAPATAGMAVPAAVTQPNDPRDIVAAVKAATSVGGAVDTRMDLLNPNIVARPLTSSTDPFFSLRPKNPNVVFRGINYCVQTKDGPSYMRFEQAKAQGYVAATPADVQGAVPASLLKEGKIINGDLILMMIDKSTYRGALKWKDQQAIRATQATGQREQGDAEIKRAAAETNMPGKLSRKLSTYAPSQSELKKDFGEAE